MAQIIGAHPLALLVDETDKVYEWTNSVFEMGADRMEEERTHRIRNRARKKYRRLSRRKARSRPVLVFQTPNLTWSHSEISTCFPGAQIVYMLRDVRGVVASMLRLSHNPFVENQIRFFRQAGFIERAFPKEWQRLLDRGVSEPVKMALVAKIKMSLAENFAAAGLPVLKVRYEDLVLSPGKTVSRITRQIGLAFDERCLAHDQVLVGFGPGLTDRARPLDKSSISKWSDQLSPETVHSIWAEVGEFYEKLGYQQA